jgi:hypothetical protein
LYFFFFFFLQSFFIVKMFVLQQTHGRNGLLAQLVRAPC